MNGGGVEKNFEEGVKWLRKSAEQGFAEAQYNLGTSYYFGRGVEQNYAMAVVWFRKAADQGNVSAQNNLGVAFACGIGVEKDPQTGYGWLLLASSSGHKKALEVLTSLEKTLPSAEQSAARNWATQWKPKKTQ